MWDLADEEALSVSMLRFQRTGLLMYLEPFKVKQVDITVFGAKASRGVAMRCWVLLKDA